MPTEQTQSKYWKDKTIPQVESYWNSPAAIKRSIWLAEKIRQYNPKSILEIGSFSGRNLKYVSEALPDTEIAGLEICDSAVEWHKQHLPDIPVYHMDLHSMSAITKRYDIVFTMGVLIHIIPEQLASVLKKVENIATNQIINVEQCGNNELVKGMPQDKPTYKVSDQYQWSPNLIEEYNSIGLKAVVSKLPDDTKCNGATDFVVVELKE